MVSKIIEFKKIKLPPGSGVQIFNLYYVIENGRTKVMEKFHSLPLDTKDLIKDLLCKMATISNFKSPKIKYNLKSYNYGEIRPMPHRFFFFQKCGNNYIFFDYILKKEDSLSDDVYKKINELKVKYEKEFQEFKQRT